jgi:hypothetical protein
MALESFTGQESARSAKGKAAELLWPRSEVMPDLGKLQDEELGYVELGLHVLVAPGLTRKGKVGSAPAWRELTRYKQIQRENRMEEEKREPQDASRSRGPNWR